MGIIYLFIYLFMALLGLRFCARAFSSCGERGPLFIAVRGPLTIAASLVGEHRLQTRRLSNCGSRAQSLHGMRDPPRPGLEPASPALAGRLSTTAPPGKPSLILVREGGYCLHDYVLRLLNFIRSSLLCCLLFLFKITLTNQILPRNYLQFLPNASLEENSGFLHYCKYQE